MNTFKNGSDANTMAAKIVAKATEETTQAATTKNPAAVASGRLGGLKGGVARAKVLSPKKRAAIAKKAAAARWKNKKEK